MDSVLRALKEVIAAHPAGPIRRALRPGGLCRGWNQKEMHKGDRCSVMMSWP
ncbi:MAG TPA: hypothetical protein VFA54_05240 [Bryobacterales bacterium]|nr:hypothetical protein [Bryobacterales bacterium]